MTGEAMPAMPTTGAHRFFGTSYRLAARFVVSQPLGAAGLLAIVVMLLASVLARWAAPYDPVAIDFGAMLARPSPAHLFGTDQFGRDVLSRIIYGARISMIVGLCAAGELIHSSVDQNIAWPGVKGDHVLWPAPGR